MNISRRNPVSSPNRKPLRSILTSYVVIRVFLGHPIYLFPSDYPIKTFYTFLFPPIHSHSSPISFNLVLLGVMNQIRDKNWCTENKMLQCLCKLQTLCSCDRASWAKREERIPTRCNNTDDLLSIVDVDYWQQSRHVSVIFMPIIRRKDHVLLHSAHTLQRSTTVPQPATSNTTSKYTPYAVTRGLFSWWWA